MPALFLSLLLCLALMLVGREAVRVARLSEALGPGPGLFAAIWVSAVAASTIAGWLSTLLAPVLPGDGKHMLLAIALLLAGIEQIVLRPGRKPREPTRSAGAIVLVLFATQLTDGARFVVLAVAVVTAEPWLAAAGGALGSGAALSAAALAGGKWERGVPARRLGIALAAMLAVAALAIGLSARGLL